MLACIQDCVGLISQEVLVLVVFFLSYRYWRQVSQQRRKAKRIPKDNVKKVESEKTGRPAAAAIPQVAIKAVEAQMLKYLEQNEFTMALNTYRSLERDGRDRQFSEQFYASFLLSATKVGKLDVVRRLLYALKRSNLEPSVSFWQVLMKTLCVRKHYNIVVGIHDTFADQIPSDKVVYSCLIHAALETGMAEKASSMLPRYRDAGLQVKDHVLCFRTYAASKEVDAAEALFRHLKGDITTLMFNLLLLTCVNTGQRERALRLLEEVHGLSSEAPIADVISYNTVLKGLAQNGTPARCLECMGDMLKRNIQPDDITFTTVLDACIRGEDMSAVSDFVALFLNSSCVAGTVMTTLLIKGLVKAGCLKKALELHEDTRRKERSVPDIVMYSVLIKALVDARDFPRAMSLVEEMRSVGHVPDDIIVTHLLDGCRYSNDRALGIQLFKEYVDTGKTPSQYVLMNLLKLYGKTGAHQAAYDLVECWEGRFGEAPSVIHFTCLIGGCLRTRNYDLAWSSFELMCQRGVKADETALTVLLPGMVAGQRWRQVMAIADMVLISATLKNAIPVVMWNHAVSSMLAVGCSKEVDTIMLLMRKAGLPVTGLVTRRFARSDAKTAAWAS